VRRIDRRERVIPDHALKPHHRDGHRHSPYSDSKAYTAQKLLVEGATCVAPRSKGFRCEVKECRRSGEGSH